MPRSQDVDRGGEVPSRPRKSGEDESERSSHKKGTRESTHSKRKKERQHRPKQAESVSSNPVNFKNSSPLYQSPESNHVIGKHHLILEQAPQYDSDKEIAEGTAKFDKGGETVVEKQRFDDGNLAIMPGTEPPALRRSPLRPPSVPGAFSVPGIGGPSMDIESSTASPAATASIHDFSTFTVVNARVVDEVSPPSLGPFVEAQPMQVPSKDGHLNFLLKNRKVQIIVVFVLFLIVGLVVGTVLLLAGSGSNSSTAALSGSTDPEIEIDIFINALKPLLSEESLQSLDNPDSSESLALRWLLERSNFQDWQFQRQVQRYAMATFYYATYGPSWTDGGNWLTDDDECTWSQDYEGELCREGTLLVLKKPNNLLRGTLPDDLKLLSSLNVLDLSQNALSGIIPDAIGDFTSLQVMNLASNLLRGTLPDDLKLLSSLNVLDLSQNSLSGIIPDAIGDFTSLQVMNLASNDFSGTIPSEIGQCANIRELRLSSNQLRGEVPPELGLLKELHTLSLFGNYLTGAMPYEVCSLTNSSSLNSIDLRVDCESTTCTCCSDRNGNQCSADEYEASNDDDNSNDDEGGESSND